MRRRTFLAAAGTGLVALVGAGLGISAALPVIPKRPAADAEDALGWIAHEDGRFTLTLPRAEMGQNIATALKRIACVELGVPWEAVDVVLHATDGIEPVRATVGSESVSAFGVPLATACAALREALEAGRTRGAVTVRERAPGDLMAFRPGALAGPSPLVHGREIVTGAPLYAADIRRPGLLHGRVLRAPAALEAASRPVRWNVDAARAVPGFVAVIEDAGPALGKARGLGIVAERPGAVERVAAALDVVWAVDRSAVPPDLAEAGAAALSGGALPHAVIEGAPVAVDWDVDLSIEVPLAAHAPIEPRAAVAEWEDGRCTVWTGTQDAFYVRAVLADAFDIPERRVTVRTCRIGGAFGGKTVPTVEVEAAALARATGRPVKVQWTRAQEFAGGFHRPPSMHRIRARLAGGRIADWDHAAVSSHILFTAAVVPRWMQTATDALAGDGGVARGMAAPYRLGRARATYDLVRIAVHTGPWRGLGAGPNGLAIESAIDEAARVAGADPLAFRLDHVEDPRLAAVLVRVAEAAGWGAPATAARPGERSGRGIACGTYKGSSHAATVADVAVDAGGRVRVTRLWCAHDCGLVVDPDQVRAQTEGNLVFGIGMVLHDSLPVSEGRVIAETFADAPVPRIGDVPPITVVLVESGAPPGGAGETAMVSGPGAIANAVASATSIRPTRFPLLPATFAV